MIERRTMSDAQINESIKKRVLGAAMVVLNQEVEKKLNYEYLGIRSNMLRSTTRAITSDGVLYFGTNPWYGAAYETGNWKQYQRPDPILAKDRPGYSPGVSYQRASWTGPSRKRPFLRDTLMDPETLRKISARMKGF